MLLIIKKIIYVFFVIAVLSVAVFVYIIKPDKKFSYSGDLFASANSFNHYNEGYLRADSWSVDYFLMDGEVFLSKGNEYKQLTNDGYVKSGLEISPNNSKLGYYVSLNYSKEKEITDVDYDKYIALKIINTDGTNEKSIYVGDYHTSNWEWLSEDQVAVYRSCGTECIVAYVINANTGDAVSELFYGVGYEWSPDKTMVATLRYTYMYGIVVGDVFGNKLLEFRREHSNGYSELLDDMHLEWSDDSSKIALVIKKKNEDKLELVVFDAENDFNNIFSSDIETREGGELTWHNNKIYINNKQYEVN